MEDFNLNKGEIHPEIRDDISKLNSQYCDYSHENFRNAVLGLKGVNIDNLIPEKCMQLFGKRKPTNENEYNVCKLIIEALQISGELNEFYLPNEHFCSANLKFN